jgi:CMP-N-acetylneuraminic acid synthetase
MIAALIPARGGSKRIPRKNILPFAGRPLLAWSIAAAKAAPSFGEAWVSTDDDEIAAVAAAYGARVIRRPAELAQDNSATYDVVLHALHAIRASGLNVEAVATLQPTNPLRPVAIIEDAVAKFRARECDSLVAVSRRALKTGRIENGFFHPEYSFGQQTRMTEPRVYENGLLYITSAACLEVGSMCGSRILAYLTEAPFDVVDIDEPVDFVVGAAIAAAVADQLGY